MRNILIYFAIKYEGDFFKITEAIRRKETVDKDDLRKIEEKNYQVITCLDDNYPPILKQCSYPPLVLFYKGDISLLSYYNKKLAVIGSRCPTKYGINATKKILGELLLEEDYLIISGLAQGIDAIAHFEALENYRKTIAILGSGIDVCYPLENQDLYDRIVYEGLVLSEYPPGAKASKDHFPMRNRIIAALSDAVFVTDAKVKSGTQITVRFALEMGKDVFTIPHPVFNDSFCNILLCQGAIPVLSAKDIIDSL